jgi:hypothetical protein
MNTSFWQGFDKRAEVLSEFSDSSSTGGTALDINTDIAKRRREADPELGDRYAATGSPRLDRLTTESRQAPTGGMA